MGNANNLRSALTPTDCVRFVLRRHPLLCFFLLALGLSRVYELPVSRFLHLPFLPWSLSAPIIGPTLAAFLMTLVTEGRAGVLRLLRRCLHWRVGLRLLRTAGDERQHHPKQGPAAIHRVCPGASVAERSSPQRAASAITGLQPAQRSRAWRWLQ
jgi:hypothetical protein